MLIGEVSRSFALAAGAMVPAMLSYLFIVGKIETSAENVVGIWSAMLDSQPGQLSGEWNGETGGAGFARAHAAKVRWTKQ